MSQASDDIKDAVCDGGTPVADCDFCGRTHYTASGYCMDEGELERLEKQRAKFPARYIANHASDSISIGHIEDKQYVWNCGCEASEKRLSMIEEFLRTHMVVVLKFYRVRAKRLKETAAAQERMLSDV